MLEKWEVDPHAYANGRGDNTSTAKWDLLAARLFTVKVVPAPVAGVAAKKRYETLATDSKSWLAHFGNPDKMPTGGAQTTKEETNVDTGEVTKVPWKFHHAMWLVKEIEDARRDHKPKTLANGNRRWGKVDKQEEIAATNKEIAALTAQLAGMPASAARAGVEQELRRLQSRVAELRGVKTEEGASPVEDGSGACGAETSKGARPSTGGPASIVTLLEPLLNQVTALASNLKETPEEADARRKHELAIAQINATAQAASTQANMQM